MGRGEGGVGVGEGGVDGEGGDQGERQGGALFWLFPASPWLPKPWVYGKGGAW